MKKLLAVALVLCLLIPCAFAASSKNTAKSVDLSKFSYNELLKLKDKLNKEINKRPESKGTLVKKGYWKIGTDIPAGSYSMTLKDKRDTCFYGVWGKTVNDYQSNGGLLDSGLLYQTAPSVGKVDLETGNILELGNPVYMKPYERPDF